MTKREIAQEIRKLDCEGKQYLLHVFEDEIEQYHEDCEECSNKDNEIADLENELDDAREIIPVDIKYLGDELAIKDAIREKCEELKLI